MVEKITGRIKKIANKTIAPGGAWQAPGIIKTGLNNYAHKIEKTVNQTAKAGSKTVNVLAAAGQNTSRILGKAVTRTPSIFARADTDKMKIPLNRLATARTMFMMRCISLLPHLNKGLKRMIL